MRLQRLCRSALSSTLVLVGLAAPATGEPRIFLDADDRLVISATPPLLTDAEVKRHLDSGLTTSFVFQGGPPGRDQAVRRASTYASSSGTRSIW